ncbi:TlpA disulfide reductase family protein [Rhodopirellula sp. P2]|uniref:TlpA disulfide reductase family protein n=1 Tax=Rhodopirellula sp. P2 TaxID=2127060 RepID=UPI0023689DC2|nr:TlpA disulfide reductase family protein [Rhodopirellula sp. P2]WDQ19318.1 TlpA disulfide reductase family protein [Rhodopirellula sp. P2]
MKISSTARVFVCCFVIGTSGIAKGDDRTTPSPVEAKKLVAAKASADDEKTTKQAPKETAPESPKGLTIGSPAPSLDIEHWVGESPSPVSEFEPGKVYVVEFWATWCGPCLYSMPHLAELQSKYADDGLRVVSVSTEDLETVTEFLKRKVSPSILGIKEPAANEDEAEAGEATEETKPITFAELTSAYSLTTDPDESVNADYMKAANQNGIPTAFIVGTDGHIEWIGHPMSMDEPLEAVIHNKWDREPAKEKFEREQKIALAVREIIMAHRTGHHETTLKLLQEHADLFAGTRYESALKSIWFPTALATQQSDIVLEIIQERIAAGPDDAVSINRWAWEIYEAVESGLQNNDKILSTTIDALQSALSSDEFEANDDMWPAYDTMAHLKSIAGDKQSAVEWQRRAIESAPEDEQERLQEYLSELTGTVVTSPEKADAAETETSVPQP